MQEKSLDAFLNAGVDGGVPTSTDQSANQQEQTIAISRMIPQSEVLPTVVLVVSDLVAKMAPNRLR